MPFKAGLSTKKGEQIVIADVRLSMEYELSHIFFPGTCS
jgi:hypothetical protein